jgi:putative addiction module component (TIGR02574 family)
MSATTNPSGTSPAEIVNAALSLSPDDRAMVAHMLMESLDAPFDDPAEVKRAWKDEIGRRIADYQAGRVKTYSSDEFFAILRERREKRRPS